MTEKKPPRGLPFRSKLRPFVRDIRKWRRAGLTWAAIAERLQQQGCKTDGSTICQFMARYRRRPYPREAEPEKLRPEPSQPISRKICPLKSPPENSVTEDFDSMAEAAEETVRAAQHRTVIKVVRPTRPL